MGSDNKSLKGKNILARFLSSWNTKYVLCIAIIASLWAFLYTKALPFASWLSFSVFKLAKDSRLGASVEFFFYDVAKILLLLVAMIYVIGWLRATLNVERVRNFLSGRHRSVGYFLGSSFGAITPFCSCSSVPLFLGFTTARIPIGTTMAFLITSPLINEIAVVLLWGILGWKFTIIYVIVGMLAGIIGGWFMDKIKAQRWLRSYIKEEMEKQKKMEEIHLESGLKRLSIKDRHEFAYSETSMIFKRVWKWVIIGVGVGAGLYGFVPENWFAEHFSATEWWTVPASILVALPLYSNVTGIVPIMESLLIKGLPLGTTLAFCMSSVVASIPEVLMLRQIMQIKLQASFILYLWVIFTLVGWTFNILGPYILK